MISQEVLNLITQTVWNTPGDEWMTKTFLDHSPTERATQDNFHDVDIKHFLAAIVHQKTGENITQYKKLAKNTLTLKYKRCGNRASERKLDVWPKATITKDQRKKKLHLWNEPSTDCKHVRGR